MFDKNTPFKLYILYYKILHLTIFVKRFPGTLLYISQKKKKKLKATPFKTLKA
jgi:hypothetical protein